MKKFNLVVVSCPAKAAIGEHDLLSVVVPVDRREGGARDGHGQGTHLAPAALTLKEAKYWLIASMNKLKKIQYFPRPRQNVEWLMYSC